MTLAFEDANSKLPDDVSIVSVADVDTEERVDNSFVEILIVNLILNFGHSI